MNIEYEILLNQYGQDIAEIESLRLIFRRMNFAEKKLFLKDIIYCFIQQSKAVNEDIPKAIELSCLRPTYTPCVMITKGIEAYRLEQIVELPENELDRVLVLFLSIFKISYQRRFILEKNNPDKWWYWDMSDEDNLKKIKEQYL